VFAAANNGAFGGANNDALFMVGNGTATLNSTTGYVVLENLTAALTTSNFV
jgi:hypothetical protein